MAHEKLAYPRCG